MRARTVGSPSYQGGTETAIQRRRISPTPQAAIQAFGAGSERANHVKLAVLIGSLLAATHMAAAISTF